MSSPNSSSSSDGEVSRLPNCDTDDSEEELLLLTIANNNMVLAQLLEHQSKRARHGGSIRGHIVINRERKIANHNLFIDYFAENSRYDDATFRRRFRMSRNLFLQIVEAVKAHDNYFEQRVDGLRRLGLSPLQKMTTVSRMLSYALPADVVDDYLKIGESTTIESMKRFCRAIVEIFGQCYLKTPTAEDVARLLYVGEMHGFSGMLGSLDCMHWKWKNCPTAWAGQYAGRSGSPTIILEAVANYDL